MPIIDSVGQTIRDGHKQICGQAPTGAGKTVMFSYIAQNAIKKGNRVLILTDREELLSETSETLRDFNLHPQILKAGESNPMPYMREPLTVAMAQTLKKRTDKREWQQFFKYFDIIIIDECHKQEFNKFFELELFKGKYVLGFSATPQRSGNQRQLAEDYSILIQKVQVSDLVELGYLVPDKFFEVKGADVKGIRRKADGEYSEQQQFDRFNKRELYEGVVTNWQKHWKDTSTLVFCVNIQHAINTCKQFNDAGIKAKFVCSGVAKPKPLKDNATEGQKVKYDIATDNYNNYIAAYAMYSGNRTNVIAEWKRGDFDVLINADMLTTGFNYPALQTVIINRKVGSENLYWQMVGRGSRPAPGKEYFNLGDFGQNQIEHGHYMWPRIYSLVHKQPSNKGQAVFKECGTAKRKNAKIDPETGYFEDKTGKKGCGAYLFASQMVCDCGYRFEPDVERKEVELSYVDYTRNYEHKDDFIRKIEREASVKGYKAKWVINQVIALKGEEGLKDYVKQQGHGNGRLWHLKKVYAAQLKKYSNEKPRT